MFRSVRGPGSRRTHCVYLEKAVNGCARSAFTNQGEVCLCTERTYVHESIYDEFLAKLKIETAKWTIGDPRDPKTKVGPLVSQVHYEKVVGCFEKAKSKGKSPISRFLEQLN